MRRVLAIIFLFAVALAIQTATADAIDLTSPDTWPFIPVPVAATDPNGGVTYGVMPVKLFTDSNDQITSILAPDFTQNTTLGPGGDFRYLSYPSSDTQWYATAGFQWKIARDVDLDFQTGREHKKWWSFEGRFFFERDPTERFFGLGNKSSQGNQTNYTTEQLYFEGMFGINVTENLQLSITERPRYVRILHGGFDLPQIHEIFPQQKGINGGSELLNQFMIQYDTRDAIDIPRAGGLARVYYGVADRRFGSSVSYNRFGGELRRYLTLNNRVTFAGHLFCEYQAVGGNFPQFVTVFNSKRDTYHTVSVGTGGEMPFWSAARLGGEESILTDQEPLRGYGAGRFVDNDLVVANMEMRTRIWDLNMLGTHGILELAPFAEVGRVAHYMDFNPLSQLHPVGGLGVRAIAMPFVVGYVDIGWGGEGAAVFSGVNYPF
ncbi:MAG TPA: BamA/TamA family outer membrane protein [Candidatus Binataceae bacterium]|nr:BamA/TamA family outer membrane protein [Candidatus Binataceae bacterium]